MNIQELKRILTIFEGKRNRVYLDSVGLKTAGLGHLMTGADRDLPVGTPINETVIQNWFEADVTRSTHLAKNIIPSFDQHSDVRQQVLVTLTFNLGRRLEGFAKFIAAMEKSNYGLAAKELKNSKWFTQVGNRGPQTCAALVTGAWTI